MSKIMNSKTKLIVFISTLAVEAIVLVLLVAFTSAFDSVSFSFITVPFAQIASAVSTLCENGAALRGVGVMILAALTFLPIAYAFTDFSGKKSVVEKLSLVLLGISLGGGIILMMNPQNFLPSAFRENAEVMEQAVCTTIWSVILLALGVTGARVLASGKKKTVIRGFSAMTVFFGILFVGMAVLSAGMLLKEEAKQTEVVSGIEHVVSVLKCLKTAVPYFLDTVVAVMLFRLASIYMSEGQSHLKEAASGVRHASCALLGISLLLTVIYNAVQVLFMKEISHVKVVTELPVLSFAFVVVAVLICHLIVENKDLKDDNDLFV